MTRRAADDGPGKRLGDRAHPGWDSLPRRGVCRTLRVGARRPGRASCPDGGDAEIECGSPRRERQEEIMKTFTAFVLVAFSVALPAAFLLQIALV